MRGGPFYQRASWRSADDGSEQPRIRLARTWAKTTQLTRTRHDKARGRARAAQSLHTELQKNLSVFRRRDRHRSHRVRRARDHHDHGFGLHHRRAGHRVRDLRLGLLHGQDDLSRLLRLEVRHD